MFMGLFLGALDNPLMQEEMTAKQQFIYTAKQMGRRSFSSAKTFAVMGLIFSAAECIVEKVNRETFFFKKRKEKNRKKGNKREENLVYI